jgi:hypothetical protein
MIRSKWTAPQDIRIRRYGSVQALADLEGQTQLGQFVWHGERPAATFLDPAKAMSDGVGVAEHIGGGLCH